MSKKKKRRKKKNRRILYFDGSLKQPTASADEVNSIALAVFGSLFYVHSNQISNQEQSDGV